MVNLDDLSCYYRAARVVQVANALGIFTVLAEGEMTVDELSTRCRTRPEMTEKLLIACVAMGLLERDGERYGNTPYAETYLVRGRPLYQGDIIAHSASVWDFWQGLEDKVRLEGTSSEDETSRHRSFILGMHNIAMAGRAEALADSVDLTGRKSVLDVGGGPGTYSIVLCRRYPELHAVVFDLPETIAIARDTIVSEDLEDRVAVRAGSWETDNFGEGYDVVLLSNVLHGPGSKAGMKLAKAYHAMVGGGLLVVQDFVLNDDKSGPLWPAVFNIMVGAYSQGELFAVIRQAGFVDVDLAFRSENPGNAVITARKP